MDRSDHMYANAEENIRTTLLVYENQIAFFVHSSASVSLAWLATSSEF